MTTSEATPLQTQDAPQTPAVPSPCINVCKMNADTQWCDGCLRTIDEIRAWSKLDDDGKRAIWAELDLRHASLMEQRKAAAP
ncbi:DUF1289 domain-containing protein [Trinickia violacea]|uniref:DUF1289 domain-containing protein n=1 Tax=Trinickia violacea TaxID=2571746 RepID=A0A4P8IME7_9BURK|nr:DUF1289 domain-containing protein [Trinickia violacea]QCP48003.1 DUF1289 domain-containing protein [Trinickia violacea]